VDATPASGISRNDRIPIRKSELVSAREARNVRTLESIKFVWDYQFFAQDVHFDDSKQTLDDA
jgi:hypothetical protein